MQTFRIERLLEVCYICHRRRDLTYGVIFTSRYIEEPQEKINNVKHLLKYLRENIEHESNINTIKTELYYRLTVMRTSRKILKLKGKVPPDMSSTMLEVLLVSAGENEL